MSSQRDATPFEEAQPEIAASVASVDTAPSATPSTSAVKRHAASLLAAAQTTTKKLPGQVAGAAKALPGEMTSAGKELGGQAKDIAASTSRALSALPGQTSRALSSTKAAYAQGKAATIVHIEKSQLPDSVKRAALAALVKQRETVVVPDLSSKVALVTGGSVGLGLQVAKALALNGARVIIAGRSETRCAEAVGEIQVSIQEAWTMLHNTNHDVPHPGDVDYAMLDMTSLRAIDKFVEEWKASGNPLHLLVHCAGVMLPPHGSTEDGFEMQIGVNHIAVAHLTKLLTDTLIANAPARVVLCSHMAAARGKMTGIDLMLHNGKYCMMSNYSTSRLFNCMYANELRNRLAGKGVDVLVTHPGITVSDIEAKIERNHITGRLSKMTGIRPQPVDLGALSTIYAATNEDAHGAFGMWYGPNTKNKDNSQERMIPNQLAQDPAWCRRLYDDTFRAIADAQQAMTAALENLDAAFEAPAPVPVSSGASVASGTKVKKTGAAKIAQAAEDADPELTAVATTMHAMPAGAVPKDGTQEPTKEIKMQQAAKSGGMKGLAGLFGKNTSSKDGHEASKDGPESNGVQMDIKGKGKAAIGPNTPAKTKA